VLTSEISRVDEVGARHYLANQTRALIRRCARRRVAHVGLAAAL
jgi:hypothetical protein